VQVLPHLPTEQRYNLHRWSLCNYKYLTEDPKL
jgi:hypothetical protein